MTNKRWRRARGCALAVVIACFASGRPAGRRLRRRCTCAASLRRHHSAGLCALRRNLACVRRSGRGAVQNPSPAALDAARDAARAALLAWGRIEPLRFGPIIQQQRIERLLFYPDPHGIVAKQISQAARQARCEADIEPDKLAGASVAVQGFGAVDAVLYGNGAESSRYSRTRSVVPLPLCARSGRRHRADRRGHARRMGRRLRADLACPRRQQQDLSDGERDNAGALPRLRHRDRSDPRAAAGAGVGRQTAKPAGPLLPNSGLGLPFILADIEGERDILGDKRFSRR